MSNTGDSYFNLVNNSVRVPGTLFYNDTIDIKDDPNGDGKDPNKDNKKKKKKYHRKGSKPRAIDEKEAVLKETDMKTHFGNYQELHNSIKYNEPETVLLICPKCVEIIEFKKLRREQGAINPLTMQPILVYYCSKCYHRFSDLYANTYPHATILNLVKWCCYAGQFFDKVKVYEFPK